MKCLRNYIHISETLIKNTKAMTKYFLSRFVRLKRTDCQMIEVGGGGQQPPWLPHSILEFGFFWLFFKVRLAYLGPGNLATLTLVLLAIANGQIG